MTNSFSQISETLDLLEREEVASLIILPTKLKRKFKKELISSLKKASYYPIYLDCRLCPWVSLENFWRLLLASISFLKKEPLQKWTRFSSNEIWLAFLAREALNQLATENIVLIIDHLWPFFVFGATVPLFLESLLEEFAPKMKVVFFFSHNLESPRLKKKLSGSNLIFRNILFLPPKDIGQAEASLIFTNLTQEEKTDLCLIAHNCFPKTTTTDFFLKIGLVKRRGKKLIITNPHLLKLAQKVPRSRNNQLWFEDEKIFLNGSEVTNVFSPTEQKIIRGLLKPKDKMLTREQLAEIIWGVQWPEKYSDWAIDKALSRLRQKFHQIWLGEVLQTIKGKGVKLVLS